ncbi:hypothetical protein FF1_046587 [Malus domestica]
MILANLGLASNFLGFVFLKPSVKVSSGGFEGVRVRFEGHLRNAQVGHSVAYEFDVEVDNKVLSFKLLEDVDRWDYVHLPIFRVEDKNGLV